MHLGCVCYYYYLLRADGYCGVHTDHKLSPQPCLRPMPLLPIQANPFRLIMCQNLWTPHTLLGLREVYLRMTLSARHLHR